MSSGCIPKSTSIEAATGELGLIAFYYLLRVGEYAKPSSNLYWDGENAQEVRATRTIQLRLRDITFWQKGKILKRWKMFHLADEGTMKLTNQKNGTKNGVIHHEVLPYATKFSPVNALAKRCRHAHRHGGDKNSFLSDYCDGLQWRQITSDNITLVVKVAVPQMTWVHTH